MAVSVEDLGPCKKKLSIEIATEQVKEELDKGFSELADTATVRGFRKGHAPRWLLEKRFGKELTEDIKDKLKRQNLADALKELGLEPLGEPQFANEEFDPDKKYSFDVTIETKPDFEIENYKNMALEKMSTEVSEDDISREMEVLRKRAAEYEDAADTPIQPQDIITSSVEVIVGGEPVWKNEEFVFPTGIRQIAGTEIADFEKLITGKKAGETLTIDVKLGENFFQEQHRGKDGSIKLSVKSVKRPKLPEIDDEFAKKMGFDNLEGLKETIKEELNLHKKEQAERNLRDQVKEKLLELAKFELPEDLTGKLAEENARRRKLEMQYYGVAEDVITRESERIADSSRRQAQREIRLYLILEKIAKNEKIYATETDIQNRIEQIARSRKSTPARVRQELEKAEMMPELRSQLREEKVMDLIIKSAAITEEKKGSEEESKDEKTPAQEAKE